MNLAKRPTHYKTLPSRWISPANWRPIVSKSIPRTAQHYWPRYKRLFPLRQRNKHVLAITTVNQTILPSSTCFSISVFFLVPVIRSAQIMLWLKKQIPVVVSHRQRPILGVSALPRQSALVRSQFADEKDVTFWTLSCLGSRHRVSAMLLQTSAAACARADLDQPVGIKGAHVKVEFTASPRSAKDTALYSADSATSYPGPRGYRSTLACRFPCRSQAQIQSGYEPGFNSYRLLSFSF